MSEYKGDISDQKRRKVKRSREKLSACRCWNISMRAATFRSGRRAGWGACRGTLHSPGENLWGLVLTLTFWGFVRPSQTLSETRYTKKHVSLFFLKERTGSTIIRARYRLCIFHSSSWKNSALVVITQGGRINFSWLTIEFWSLMTTSYLFHVFFSFFSILSSLPLSFLTLSLSSLLYSTNVY